VTKDVVVAASSHAATATSSAPRTLVPVAVATALAAAAEKAVEEDYNPGDGIQTALDADGCGWVVIPRAVPDDVFDMVCGGVQALVAETAQPIINSQIHARMIEMEEAADRGRRQVPVASEGRASEEAVPSTLGSVAARARNELNDAYDGVTPHIVITMPQAPAHLPHTDAGLHVKEDSGTTLLSMYASIEEGTGIEVWSQVFGGAGEEGQCATLPTPVWVDIPAGSCLVVRSDLVHRGTSNLRGRQQRRCLHAYLAVADNGLHLAYAEYMSSPSC